MNDSHSGLHYHSGVMGVCVCVWRCKKLCAALQHRKGFLPLPEMQNVPVLMLVGSDAIYNIKTSVLVAL